MKTAVQEPPAMSGIELANWNWKVVRRFVADWFGVRLCRSSSLNYLHRLGFAFKRPKKRLYLLPGLVGAAYHDDQIDRTPVRGTR